MAIAENSNAQQPKRQSSERGALYRSYSPGKIIYELYGKSPLMTVLPDMCMLNRIMAAELERLWLRAEIKQAYAALADW
jgi:hypothetical protein